MHQQLNKRFEKREEAKAGEEEAKETGESSLDFFFRELASKLTSLPFVPLLSLGTVEEIDKMNRRQVRVTREQNLECQKLLKLMGIPVVVVRLSFRSSSSFVASSRADLRSSLLLLFSGTK